MTTYPIDDPVLQSTSWIPSRTTSYLGGENRLTGQVIQVGSWYQRSDANKVKALRELAEKYGKDPHLRWFTVNKVLRPAGVAQRDYRGQAAAILKYVQDTNYYTNEPDEQVQSPWRTLAVRTGDCDDAALLAHSMATSIGLPARFVLAGKDRQGRPVRWADGERVPWGANFNHIYLDIGWPALSPRPTWASAEPTIKGAPLGYDVIRDGLRWWNEPAASTIQGGGGVMAGYGGGYGGGCGCGGSSTQGQYGLALADLQVSDEPGFLGLSWSDIVRDVVGGTITAVAIAITLKWLKV